MKDENSLEKKNKDNNMNDTPFENKDNENIKEKKKIIPQQNVINISDDDLDHPNPLESDYYEEGKEEIKKNFYQNQLKEKEKNKKNKEKIKDNMNKKSLNEDIKKDNLKYSQEKKNNCIISIKPRNSGENCIKKEKAKLVDASEKQNIKMKKNYDFCEIKRDNFSLKCGFVENPICIEKEKMKEKQDKNNINKENININIVNNKSVEIIKKAKDNQQSNIKINSEMKIPKQFISSNKIEIKIDQELNKCNNNMDEKQENKIGQVPLEKKENLNNNPQKIIKKRIPSYQINSNSNAVKKLNNKMFPNRIIKKINKSMNCTKNIIYNNSVISLNNILENKNQNQKKENINFQNKSYQENNNNTIINNNKKQNEEYHPVNNKNIPRKLGAKSLSYSNIPLNKNNDNPPQLIKNKNCPFKENNLPMEKNKIESNINQIVSPKKIQHPKFNSYENANKILEKKEIINKIPNQVNNQNNLVNKQFINKKQENNQLSNMKYHPMLNKYNTITTNNSIQLNNIHNNYNLYNDEQKENIPDNSECKKKTFQVGGKFNNIQTTYVVIAKNSNSKIKIMPKANNTIDYEKNKFLFPTKSVIHLQPSKYYYPQGQNNIYFNTEKNIYYNQNLRYYPSYMENQSINPKAPSNQRKIKMYKSQKNLNINKGNDYGNDRNYMECPIHGKQNQTINIQNRDTFFLNDISQSGEINNNENYDYYNYQNDHQISDPYLSYTMKDKYLY